MCAKKVNSPKSEVRSPKAGAKKKSVLDTSAGADTRTPSKPAKKKSAEKAKGEKVIKGKQAKGQVPPPFTDEKIIAHGFKEARNWELVESKTNPRKSFNDKELKELAASIKSVGILQPLIVRLTSRVVPPYYEIICGARRFRAGMLVNLDTFPVIVKAMTDEQVLEVQIVENLQRADVHPLDEAAGYKCLIDSGRYDVQAIATRVGKLPNYIYGRLRLNYLIEDVKKALDADEITIAHALLFANLDEKIQKETFEIYKSNTWRQTIKGLQEIIANSMMLMKEAPFEINDSQLLKTAGSCGVCPKRTGKNPFLFDDWNKKSDDKCTDKNCWEAKIDATIDQKKKELEAKGEKVQLISMNWAVAPSLEKKNIIGCNSYTVNKKGVKCEHLVTGLIAHGGLDSDPIGKTMKICIEKSCKVHHPEAAGKSDNADGAGETKSTDIKQPKINRDFSNTVEKVMFDLEHEIKHEILYALLHGETALGSANEDTTHVRQLRKPMDFLFDILMFIIIQIYRSDDYGNKFLFLKAFADDGTFRDYYPREEVDAWWGKHTGDDFTFIDEEDIPFIVLLMKLQNEPKYRKDALRENILLRTLLAMILTQAFDDQGGITQGDDYDFTIRRMFEMIGPLEYIVNILKIPHEEKINEATKAYFKKTAKMPELQEYRYGLMRVNITEGTEPGIRGDVTLEYAGTEPEDIVAKELGSADDNSGEAADGE